MNLSFYTPKMQITEITVFLVCFAPFIVGLVLLHVSLCLFE